MTTWNELFTKEFQPTEQEIADFVGTPLWGELRDYLEGTYSVKPKVDYSGCSMDGGAWKGWNVKYKKSGKSLCTLYPKEGYFLSLITVGASEIEEAELLVPLFCDYVKERYIATEVGKNYGKMIGLEVTDEEILRDMKKLIDLRVKKK
ncbi:hypothetical protein M2140_000252 [Clostridiales Family XIII bacterium PM5-7]